MTDALYDSSYCWNEPQREDFCPSICRIYRYIFMCNHVCPSTKVSGEWSFDRSIDHLFMSAGSLAVYFSTSRPLIVLSLTPIAVLSEFFSIRGGSAALTEG